MNLNLSPIRGLPGAPETEISVSGDVLTVDGVVYDLSAIPEGGAARPVGTAHPFIGSITRSDGVVTATLRVVLDDSALPAQPGSPWTLNVTDGAVVLPADRIDSEGAP